MDKIQQKKLKGPNGELVGGLVTADQVLAQISKLFNWHATRAKFTSPLVKGMRRAPKPKERARRRVLTDQELRLMWPILGEMGTHGAAVKCMLLTAQRARKVEQMRRSDIKDRYQIPSHEQNGERVAEQWVENVWDAKDDAQSGNVTRLDERRRAPVGGPFSRPPVDRPQQIRFRRWFGPPRSLNRSVCDRD